MRVLVMMLLLTGCTTAQQQEDDYLDLRVEMISPDCSCILNGREEAEQSGETLDVNPGRMTGD
jgi:hypothetical protein